MKTYNFTYRKNHNSTTALISFAHLVSNQLSPSEKEIWVRYKGRTNICCYFWVRRKNKLHCIAYELIRTQTVEQWFQSRKNRGYAYISFEYVPEDNTVHSSSAPSPFIKSGNICGSVLDPITFMYRRGCNKFVIKTLFLGTRGEGKIEKFNLKKSRHMDINKRK